MLSKRLGFLLVFIFVFVFTGFINSTYAAFPVSRNKYQWPFSKYSIWNMPIGSGAQYVVSGLQANDGVYADIEPIGLNPNDPIKTVNGSTQVHVPPTMSWDGSWNGCTTLLLASDLNSFVEGEPMVLSPGGNPNWSNGWPPTTPNSPQLNGPGYYGCHGGSGLSGVGGSIRKGELSAIDPIRHALKLGVYCHYYCYPGDAGNGGIAFRWPAVTHDDYAFTPGAGQYGGTNPNLQQGSLLALPKNADLSFITSPRALKIAQALRDYGAYIMDDTYSNNFSFGVEQGAEWGDTSSFGNDLDRVVTMLQIISNNHPNSIGGGGNPQECLAPAFADGTVDGVAINPNGNVTQPANCNSTSTPVPTLTPTPTITPLKPGDANGDGKVDNADYLIWQANQGKTTQMGSSAGDFNVDTHVDGLDYVIWLNNFGH